MAIKFYSWPRSSGSKVQWALDELGLTYEHILVDRAKGEHRTPEYLAINPNGKVPALVDGEDPYFESLAIVLYLAGRYGMDKGLWPSAGRGFAEALSWTVWGVTELHAFMMQFIYHGLDSPVSYRPADRSRATADYNYSQLSWLLDLLDKRLEGRDYIMGAFSLVDVPAADALLTGKALGLEIVGRPNLETWIERCRTRPARGL